MIEAGQKLVEIVDLQAYRGCTGKLHGIDDLCNLSVTDSTRRLDKHRLFDTIFERQVCIGAQGHFQFAHEIFREVYGSGFPDYQHIPCRIPHLVLAKHPS